jgi:hypothetical protein
VYFSSEDDASCEPSTNHPGFTMQHIPKPRFLSGRACYNLADLFVPNFSRGQRLPERPNTINALNATISNANAPNTTNGTISTATGFNRLHLSVLNAASFTFPTNYSRIWYQQTNESMDGTTAPGEMAARLLTVYTVRDCRQSRGYPPKELELAPVYSWTCQSEASGECFSTPEEIQSFHISSAAVYGDGKKCVTMEARGSAEELRPGCFLSVFVGFMIMMLVGLVL